MKNTITSRGVSFRRPLGDEKNEEGRAEMTDTMSLRERIWLTLRGKSRERSDGEWLLVDEATDAILPVVEQAICEEREKVSREIYASLIERIVGPLCPCSCGRESWHQRGVCREGEKVLMSALKRDGTDGKTHRRRSENERASVLR